MRQPPHSRSSSHSQSSSLVPYFVATAAFVSLVAVLGPSLPVTLAGVAIALVAQRLASKSPVGSPSSQRSTPGPQRRLEPRRERSESPPPPRDESPPPSPPTSTPVDDATAQRIRHLEHAAEVARHAKSDFMARMSHELRTPMNGLMGMSELLSLTKLDEEQADYLRVIRASSEKLLSLINDLLDYSRIETGELTLAEAPFQIRGTLFDAVRPYAAQAAEKEIFFSWEVSPDVPERLLGDPGRLRNILGHLLDNAVKFTESGHVQLRVHRTGGSSPTAELEFRVSDTGVGFPAQLSDQVFQPFTQADGTFKRPHGGMGLGLTIASQLARSTGGHIEVESAMGRGTVAVFRAPFPIAAGGRNIALPPDQLKGVPLVLVGEPSPARWERASELAGWGCEVVQADNVAWAIASLEEITEHESRDPLLVIATESDSFSIVEEVRAHGRHERIVVLTAAGIRGDAVLCRTLGISAYLTGPIRCDDLYHALCLTHAAQGPITPAWTRHTLREHRRSVRVLLVAPEGPAEPDLCPMLEPHSCVTTTATSCAAAAEAIEAGDIDLVLVAKSFPELDPLLEVLVTPDGATVPPAYVLGAPAGSSHCAPKATLPAIQLPVDEREMVALIGAIAFERPMVHIADPPANDMPATAWPRLLDELGHAIKSRDSDQLVHSFQTLESRVDPFSPPPVLDLARGLSDAIQAEDFESTTRLLPQLEAVAHELSVTGTQAAPSPDTAGTKAPVEQEWPKL